MEDVLVLLKNIIWFAFIQATQICENYGFRLCELDVLRISFQAISTTEEDISGECSSNTHCKQYGCIGTGCFGDHVRVWSRNSVTYTTHNATENPSYTPTENPTFNPADASMFFVTGTGNIEGTRYSFDLKFHILV